MPVSKHERTVTFEEVRVTGENVRELRRAVDDFMADEARGNPDAATWRVENDSVILSIRMTESRAG